MNSDVARAVSDDGYAYLPEYAVNNNDLKELIAYDRHKQSVSDRSKGRYLFDNIVFKPDFIGTFNVIKSILDVRPAHAVLELGAAHGWASTIVKDDCLQLMSW